MRAVAPRVGCMRLLGGAVGCKSLSRTESFDDLPLRLPEVFQVWLALALVQVADGRLIVEVAVILLPLYDGIHLFDSLERDAPVDHDLHIVNLIRVGVAMTIPLIPLV